MRGGEVTLNITSKKKNLSVVPGSGEQRAAERGLSHSSWMFYSQLSDRFLRKREHAIEREKGRQGDREGGECLPLFSSLAL